MFRTPVSGLEITDAASLKVVTGIEAAGAAGAVAPGCAGAVVEGAGCGCCAPAGSTLSVSCRISLMLATSVSQNLLAETELTTAVELFWAVVVAAPGCADPLTWVETLATLRASRASFT